GIQGYLPLLASFALPDFDGTGPLPQYDVSNPQSGDLAHEQARLQQDLKQSVIALAQSVFGLTSSTQQRRHLQFGQAQGTKIADRPRQLHLRRRVRWHFPLALRPTAEAPQRLELTVDTRWL